MSPVCSSAPSNSGVTNDAETQEGEGNLHLQIRSTQRRSPRPDGSGSRIWGIVLVSPYTIAPKATYQKRPYSWGE